MAAFKDIKVKVIFALATIIVTSMVIGFPKANANRIRENEVAMEEKFDKNNEEHKEIRADVSKFRYEQGKAITMLENQGEVQKIMMKEIKEISGKL